MCNTYDEKMVSSHSPAVPSLVSFLYQQERIQFIHGCMYLDDRIRIISMWDQMFGYSGIRNGGNPNLNQHIINSRSLDDLWLHNAAILWMEVVIAVFCLFLNSCYLS